jgi:hypothetical protein
MMTHDEAQQFAADWIAAWNAHDLDRILSFYEDDFEMTSPLIVQRMSEPSGMLKGKEKIRPYWAIGLAAQPPLRFELLAVFRGVRSIAMQYRRHNGQIACEVLVFNSRGKVVQGIAHHGA